MTISNIYLIAHQELKRPDGIMIREGDIDYYKIGKANDPENRMEQLRTGTPHILKLVAKIKTKNGRLAEKELHHLFYWRRHSGEWFDLDKSHVEKFEDLEGEGPFTKEELVGEFENLI